MSHSSGLPRLQFRRVNPVPGLMIDETVWQDAHDYHRNQMRLHHLALHGWGIVQGLDIDVGDDNTLTIQPGVAIDPSGNFVIVNDPTPFHVDARGAGTVYLVLQFRDVLSGPAQTGLEGVGPPTRIAELYQVQLREQAPGEPTLELARIDFDPHGKTITLSEDPEHPRTNELDLRHRPRLGTSAAPTSMLLMLSPSEPDTPELTHAAARTTTTAVANSEPDEVVPIASQDATPVVAPPKARLSVALGRHAGPGWDAHLEGLTNLGRQIATTLHMDVPPPESLPLSDADEADLLYVSGQAGLQTSDSDLAGAVRLLEKGGTLLAEGCAAGPGGDAGAREFALSVVDLATRLGYQLSDVQRGHRLMSARHLFAVLPPGARERARLLESGGIVYSDADYGCVWQGGPSDRPVVRGVIRDALELGVNLAAYRRASGN